MFNKFNLSDEEITKIIRKYEKMIIRNSEFNHRLDEDISQEIIVRISQKLSKWDKNHKNFNKF